MPFGLRNAYQSYQYFMDEVLEGLDCIFIYLVDILEASNTKEEHKIHLGGGLQASPAAWPGTLPGEVFVFASSVEFLGQHVSMQGLCSLGTHVAAIKANLRLTIKSQLMSFLGMLSFY